MNTTENTPAHCHDCHQFADCRQAQNMMADANRPEVGCVHSGEVYCVDCAKVFGYATLYEGPSDYPVHCAGCGVPIIHDLTQEGIDYVRNNLDGCCREVWPTVWGIIPVNLIMIPREFVELCQGWHSGQGCMLYAVCSTGNLTTGTIRPRGCDSDEKWYLTIWRDLSRDVYSIVCSVGDEYDNYDLFRFDEWIDDVIIRLERSYGLEDWERE